MNTFVQLLRVAFWMLPFQRALTLIGAVVCVAGLVFRLPGNLPGSTLPAAFIGAALMLITPLFAGGALFRMVSSPRAIQLLPHARARLFTGMIGVVLVATLVWIVTYWGVFHRVPAQFRPDLEAYALMYMLTLLGATQCAITVFVASRGPLWALVALVAWQVPALVLRIAGVEDAPRLLTGPVGLASVVLAWTAFGIWYLRTPRVQPQGWSRGSLGHAGIPSTPAATTREQAMERWLLGAGTPRGIALQWTLGVAVLVGMQLLLGRGSPPGAVSAMALGTLSFSAVVIGAVAMSIAARSRGLWLTGARGREALFHWCERLMLRVAASILLPFMLLGVALWWWLPSQPSLPGVYLLPAVLLPGFAAGWYGLLRVQRQALPDALAALAVVGLWYLTLVRPLFAGQREGEWLLIVAELALIVLLRQLALWRWRGADWPRARRMQPLG